jgi:periplasmic protein TonB
MSVAAFVPRTHGAQRAGFLVVLGLHLLIGLALLYGLAHTALAPVKPPIVLTQPLPPIDEPQPKPIDLPRPHPTVLQNNWVPVPDDPIVLPQQQGPTITASREPVANPGPSTGEPTGIAQPAPLSHPAPRVAAQPVISNVQACAPTADDYPVSARRAEAAGTTRLRFTVSAAGTLVGSEIVRSAGPSRDHKLLDRVAQTKLAGCSFGAGADENGRAIGGTFEVDYVWKIEF